MKHLKNSTKYLPYLKTNQNNSMSSQANPKTFLKPKNKQSDSS